MPAECAKRLRERIRTSDDIEGDVGESGGALHITPGLYRNPFRTVLRIEWRAAGPGSRVTCHAGLHAVIVALTAIWLALVVLIGGALLFASLAKSDQAKLHATATHLIVMLTGGGALFTLGRFLARNDEKRLIAFVQSALDANASGDV